MFRRLRIILITFKCWILNRRHIHLEGFQDLSTSTIISLKNGKLRLGTRIKTYPHVSFYVCGGDLSIGKRTTFNCNCMITCRNKISIGERCAFGPNTLIYDHDHKYDYDGFRSDEYNTNPVVIENGCWIGANVIILKGTHIGECSVIGAGTILKGNIPPHSLVYSTSRELIIKKIPQIKNTSEMKDITCG